MASTAFCRYAFWGLHAEMQGGLKCTFALRHWSLLADDGHNAGSWLPGNCLLSSKRAAWWVLLLRLTQLLYRPCLT